MTSSVASSWVEWPQPSRQQSVDKATDHRPQPSGAFGSGSGGGDLAFSFSRSRSAEPRADPKRRSSGLRALFLDPPGAAGLPVPSALSRVASVPSGRLRPQPAGERSASASTTTSSSSSSAPKVRRVQPPAEPFAHPSKLSTLSVLAEAPRHGGGQRQQHPAPPPAHCGASQHKSRPSSSEQPRPQPQPVPRPAAPAPDALVVPPPLRTLSVTTPDRCPPYGCKGHIGQRSQMQDSHTVVQNFAHLEVPQDMATLQHWPDTLPSPLGDSHESTAVTNGMEVDSSTAADCQKETFHFFAVYDGHGGCSASSMCAQNLHSRVLGALGGDGGYQYSRRIPPAEPKKDEEGESVELLGQRLDVAGSGNSVPGPVSPQRFSGAVSKAFHTTDKEVAASQAEAGVEDYAGSTAVVTILSKTQIWVANCGDSRAVLLRGGKAIPLSSDQTASRDDEITRIESKGGEIYYLQDCARVMGVLAMSRSIGDVYLHPYVIPDPEHTAIPRHADDELLILGTDGLWDKIGNQEACNVARQCMARAEAKGASRKAGTKCAAAVLIKTALNKGSRDNATAIVIDLRCDDAYEAKPSA